MLNPFGPNVIATSLLSCDSKTRGKQSFVKRDCRVVLPVTGLLAMTLMAAYKTAPSRL